MVTSSQISQLDVFYRKFLLTKFFTKGWGSIETLQSLVNFRKFISHRQTCYNLVCEEYPIEITKTKCESNHEIIEGRFLSPLEQYLPNVVSPEIRIAQFQLIIPVNWKKQGKFRPLCIHLAGTGDHYFWRRRMLMALPLVQEGIASIILENPFYGLRKPKNQLRSSLRYVSDIFTMGGCLILESIVLLNWCRKMGFNPLGITGISMGGHMASLAASNWPNPLVLVPCLSWSTASSVFTEGVMSKSINWHLLQNEFLSNEVYYNVLSKECKIVDNPLKCNFASQGNLSSLLREQEDLCYVTPHKILELIKKDGPKTDTNISLQKINFGNRFSIPLPIKSFTSGNSKKHNSLEALWFMKGVMDECTHLKNFSVPYDTSLIVSVYANADGYIPRHGISQLEDLWPGSTVRYIDAGHIYGFLRYRKFFIDCIIEAFEKAKAKLC